ncbi:hypothetical protein PoB_002952700 [Plakobranchus ocellatus]|uniref:Secreted protein n=1 Tax=Plakobranchus ocellatus TaxID=259542 RepID=A0AAV4A6W0_9GAST|nr:hypothetical protein PoB_002952700 [Plakobranchus ocellatus]
MRLTNSTITGLVIRAATVSRIMRGHVMATPFPLSNSATDVRPGWKTQRIAPAPRQVADLVCARIKEREYYKTCIVGQMNCCLQCGPTLTCRWTAHSKRRPTLEAAVHVSNNTCFEILSFFGAGAHQVGDLSERRSYPLCFTAWSYVSGSVG